LKLQLFDKKKDPQIYWFLHRSTGVQYNLVMYHNRTLTTVIYFTNDISFISIWIQWCSKGGGGHLGARAPGRRP